MKWKKRLKEIEKLKNKHGKDRSLVRSFPDYSVKGTSPLSNYIGGTGQAKPYVEGRKEFLVGNFHKQGPMLVFKSELQWAGGKKS